MPSPQVQGGALVAHIPIVSSDPELGKKSWHMHVMNESITVWMLMVWNVDAGSECPASSFSELCFDCRCRITPPL